MHRLTHPVAIGLIGLSSLFPIGCFGSSNSTAVPKFKQQALEKAIFFLEGNLGSLSDVGYTQWTPTTAATELVETMNVSQRLLPEEQAEYEAAGIQPQAEIPYVLNQPTGPWQIVLVPDDKQQTIHVKAYGEDLETPLIEKSFPCCR